MRAQAALRLPQEAGSFTSCPKAILVCSCVLCTVQRLIERETRMIPRLQAGPLMEEVPVMEELGGVMLSREKAEMEALDGLPSHVRAFSELLAHSSRHSIGA